MFNNRPPVKAFLSLPPASSKSDIFFHFQKGRVRTEMEGRLTLTNPREVPRALPVLWGQQKQEAESLSLKCPVLKVNVLTHGLVTLTPFLCLSAFCSIDALIYLTLKSEVTTWAEQTGNRAFPGGTTDLRKSVHLFRSLST